jgi:hypothetical protein
MALPGNVRWYGWAAVVGGVLFAASDFVARLAAPLDGPEGEAAKMGVYAVWSALSLLALALLQVALRGLYSTLRETAGTLGWVGFFLASMGIAFAFLIVSVYAFVALPVTPDDPELLQAGPPAMFLLYFPLFSAGWVLLGAALLRSPIYPHQAALLLVAGAVLALHPNPLTTVIFSAAVAWLGLALVLGDAPPDEQSRRHPLVRGEGGCIMDHGNRAGIRAPAYFFVGKHTEAGLTLLSERASDGARAVLVFEEDAPSEAFRIIEGLGPGWRSIERAPRGTADLLETCAGAGARYVALDPPSELTRGEEQSKLVPIEAFIDHLLDR